MQYISDCTNFFGSKITRYTVYMKSFEAEKCCGFCGFMKAKLSVFIRKNRQSFV